MQVCHPRFVTPVQAPTGEFGTPEYMDHAFKHYSGDKLKDHKEFCVVLKKGDREPPFYGNKVLIMEKDFEILGFKFPLSDFCASDDIQFIHFLCAAVYNFPLKVKYNRNPTVSN